MFKETYRRMTDRIHADERLICRTLYAMQPQRRRVNIRRMAILGVSLVLCLMLGTSALASSVPAFNSWLYQFMPDVALYFRPVNMADENNGVRMEVEAIRIDEREAQIYVTVTDLEGGRLDETVDLFDSYGIDLPGYSSAYCQNVHYDPETCSATFLIRYMSEKEIHQDKLTFMIRQMLTQKKNSVVHIYPQDYAPLDSEVQSILPTDRVRGGGFSEVIQEEHNIPDGEPRKLFEFLEQQPVLKPESINVELTEGVRLTGIGYIDGMLHIQLHYSDIAMTDNHGFMGLRTASGDTVSSYMSISFWDDAHTGSYEDYIFDIAATDLQGVRFTGRFVTCTTLVNGPWSVTFPLIETP